MILAGLRRWIAAVSDRSDQPSAVSDQPDEGAAPYTYEPLEQAVNRAVRHTRAKSRQVRGDDMLPICSLTPAGSKCEICGGIGTHGDTASAATQMGTLEAQTRATERDRAARRELEEIRNRTATLSDNLRQFQMRRSDSTDLHRGWPEQILELQEHVETLYGMMQRVCTILLEDVL